MNYLKWDYGALEADQEEEYVQELLRMKKKAAIAEYKRQKGQGTHGHDQSIRVPGENDR